MLPDTGERYLSKPLFDDIPVNMTEAEIALSESTAGDVYPRVVQILLVGAQHVD
jgi:hypothetical protein